MKLSTLKFEVMAMFNQRKSFLKGKLFYIVLLALFGFGIWLNQPMAEQNPSDGVKTGVDDPISTGGSAKDGSQDSVDIMENIIGKGSPATPGGVVDSLNESDTGDPDNKGYYLVKEIDGVIKVFYYDEEGKESLLRETDIAFSLLSVADQALFQKGVIKHTVEELDELLQDFES